MVSTQYRDNCKGEAAHPLLNAVNSVLSLLTAGKISIEHVTILSKYISKGAIDMKCSPDVGNHPIIHTCRQTKTNKFRN